MATRKRKQPVANSRTSNKAVMDELKNIALVGAGVVVGSLGGQMIDKMLGVDTTATPMNPKAFVRPALLAGGGAFATVKSKNKMVKLVSAGVGVAGVLSGAKMLMKKDFLAGLGNAEIGSPFYVDESMGMYNEALNMSIEKYNPNLPMLTTSRMSDSDEMSGVEGMEDTTDFEIM